LLAVLLLGCESSSQPPTANDHEGAPISHGDGGLHIKPGAGNVGELVDPDGSTRPEADGGGHPESDGSVESDAAAGCVPSGVERCNLRDDDCNGKVDEGFDVGTACDGDDVDACKNGVLSCDGKGQVFCDESGLNTEELCDGVDNDCDGKTDEGFALGGTCDGADGDHCADGTVICDGPNATRCSDDDASALEVCNGIDDDCNAATADGSGEPTIDEPCDGDDLDACIEGVIQCASGKLGCSDSSSDTPDVCNGLDDDCDPNTPDGSGDSQFGTACDGADADQCDEGSYTCSGNAGLVCSDATASNLEICNGLDDDCDGNIDESVALCAGATSLGAVRGDVSGDKLMASGHTEAWYTLTVSDTAASIAEPGDVPYLSASIGLDSGAGTDYDLEVYCTSCGGALAGSSDLDAGEVDFVDVRANDGANVDTFSVLIHVVYYEATACADWTLMVQSNTAVATKTCN
jgi:hypothetical protein